MNSFALYIHYPFCIKRCPYCGFSSSVDRESLADQYHRLILRELSIKAKQASWNGGRVSSIYFGGGTPSLMPPEFLEKLLREIHQHWTVSPSAEITLEANPGTSDMEHFRNFFDLGVNRLSIGAQSFHEVELKQLGRIHDVDAIIKTVSLARETGFQNLSLDLIYGVPGQTVTTLEHSIRRILELNVEHLSTYSLSIEPDTVYERRIKLGKMFTPDPDLMADQFNLLCSMMNGAGFEHYELTNFAKPDHWSRHNFTYWRRLPYLGLGCSAHSFDAHSFDGALRFWNHRNISDYMAALGTGSDPRGGQEILQSDMITEEKTYLALRTWDGLDMDFALKYCKADALNNFLDKGYLEMRENRLHIPEKHWLLLDEVVLRLLEV